MDYSGDGIDSLKCLWERERGRGGGWVKKKTGRRTWRRELASAFFFSPSPPKRPRPSVCKSASVNGCGVALTKSKAESAAAAGRQPTINSRNRRLLHSSATIRSRLLAPLFTQCCIP